MYVIKKIYFVMIFLIKMMFNFRKRSKDITLDDLRKNIFYLRKYIWSPLLKENEDSVTLHIEKYINDELVNEN